jgi:hypothetical protein
MTSRADTATRPQDVRYRRVGLGMLGQRFICAKCDGRKPVAGRRLLAIKGCKQFVCAGCVAGETEAGRAAA